jgi:hypothetical protein
VKCTVSGQVSVRSIDITQLPGTATGVAFDRRGGKKLPVREKNPKPSRIPRIFRYHVIP